MVQNSPSTLHTLLGKRVALHQSTAGYRAGLDAVLLAAAVNAQPGDKVLELGTGSGAVSLCLLARCPGIKIEGIENDPAMLQICRANIAENECDANFTLHALDLTLARLGMFDHVLANPPFHDSARHGEGLAASHMRDAELDAWVACAARHVKPRGTLTMIHRADALFMILALLPRYEFGAIKIKPVQPRAHLPSKRVIVSAIRQRKTPLELLPALIVHEDNNSYTQACNAILKDGQPLIL